MSDQELGKKMVERAQLFLFLEAYEDATGDRLELVRGSERPDFICARGDETLVGVELTKVMRDPESAFWDRIMNSQEFRRAMETNDHIWSTAECKSHKLKAENWHHSKNTILVVQVMDCPLSHLYGHLEDSFSPKDFAGLGFAEIWVGDYSGLDAYGAIELFCLYPEDLWGYRERDRGKPYG